MSVSSTRIAAAALVLLLALVGSLGWERLHPTPTAHVEMLAAIPEPVRSPLPSYGVTAPASGKPETSALAFDADAVQLPSAPTAAAQTAAVAPPSFDIVRVEPSGDALLAGRSEPNSTVALVDRGKIVAEAKTDAGGNFVMMPPALKPGGYALTLRAGQGGAALNSKQSVVVSVPASNKQQVVVAMSEPGKPTTLLSVPPANSAEMAPAKAGTSTDGKSSSASSPKLAIHSVELENGSGLFASGTAPPGADVRVYLNDSRVADVVAAAAGAWTLKVRRGLAAGRYAVRVDSLKPNQSVGARVEVPFDVPVASAAEDAPRLPESVPVSPPARIADGSPPASKASAAPQPSQADAVIDELKTDIVTRGDNLWRISRKRLGHGTRYTEIYAANVAQIRNPKLVYPGQVFVLPEQ